MESCILTLKDTDAVRLLDFALFVVGLLLLVFWLIAFTSFFKRFDPPIILRSKIYRKMVSLHRFRFIIPISLTIGFTSYVTFFDNYPYLFDCYIPNKLIDYAQVPYYFILFLGVCRLMGNQGLITALGDDLKLSWDRDNKLHMHLLGAPNITNAFIQNMGTILHSHIADFRKHDIRNTIALDSWLFLRKTQNVDPKVKVLRKIVYSKKLHKRYRIAERDEKHALKLWIKTLTVMRLLWSLRKICALMKRIPMPSPILVSSIGGVRTTDEADTLIRHLSTLCPQYNYCARPIRKIRTFALIILIMRNPGIGKIFFPFTTGIEIK